MRKILTLVVCSLLAICTVSASQYSMSGTFKNGGTWKVENGVLYVDAETIPDAAGPGWREMFAELPGEWVVLTRQNLSDWWGSSYSITKVILSGKVKKIGKYAFSGLVALKKVEIASTNNIEIGEGAFYDCFALTSFDFSHITKIGKEAFAHNYRLGPHLVMPKITYIGENAFNYCGNFWRTRNDATPSFIFTGNVCPTIENQENWGNGNYFHSFGPFEYRTFAGSKIKILVFNSAVLSSLQNNTDLKAMGWVAYQGGLLYQNFSSIYTYYWGIFNDYYNESTNNRLVIRTSIDMEDYVSTSEVPWYSYRSQIKYIDILGNGSKNVYIGKNAFNGLSSVKEVCLDAGAQTTTKITRIGASAFANCSNLEKINFIKTVQEIGKNAFENCAKINYNLSIPAATTIGDAAFDGCHFKDIVFGENLQSIGQNAFRGSFADGGHIYVYSSVPATSSNSFQGANTSSTTLHVDFTLVSGYQTTSPWSSFQKDVNVTFPVSGTWGNSYTSWMITQDGVLIIKQGGQYGTSKLPDYANESDQPWYLYRDYIKKVDIEEGLKGIGKNAFASPNEGESQIAEVVVPASVETIGENAFKNNDQIEEVKAEGVKNIGSQAFENCSALEKVKFGKEVSSMGEKVFNNCGLVDVMAVKSATPPAITARTFEGLGRMSANAPAKVKAKYAARKATSATGQKSVSLEVPDEHISKYLAAQYWNLFTFEYIGEHGGIVESDQAYDGLYVLYSDGTMIISASAPTDPQNINTGFTISSSAKSKVKRVEIQGLLTKLGHQFNDCPNLEEVVLSGGINSLNGTFNNCPKLKTINLENVQYLKSHQQGNKVIPCFGGCVALKEVNIPGVLEIGDNCFKGCTGLTKVALGGEAEVGMEAFSGCTALKRIALGNAKLNGALQAFQGCTALKEMTYSGTRMPAEIFKGCTALHKINLGGSLKDILSEAFANTSIDSIYVQCPTPPEAAANAFSGINLSSIKVIVPDAFDGPYSSAPVWEEMFTYEDEDYAELDFPIHFAIGNNGFGTVDESGNLTINAMGALVDNFRDYVEPYAPYIIGEIRIGNEVSSLPAGTPYRLPFGWVKEDGPRAIILGSGLLELGDYALYNNVWDCDLIVDCYALNPPVMKGANVFNWSKIQNGSQCVATLNVVNDAAVEAAYRADTYWKKFSISSWLTPADAPAECTVTFVDWDGTILQQTTTRPGMMVTPPADPVREGYTFKGWDSQDYTWVVSDLTITATYYDETFTVRFYDWDGTLLSEQQVHYGQAAEAPADPAREGYTFLGWSEDFSAVTLDKYIVAMYHNDHEGIEDIQPDQVPNIKVMIDGVIYILRDGKIYNILGTEVR